MPPLMKFVRCVHGDGVPRETEKESINQPINYRLDGFNGEVLIMRLKILFLLVLGRVNTFLTGVIN